MSIDVVLRDVRHALRGMLRDPGFTVVAVLTLALGIGATTAVFSFTTAIMSARIPGRDIDRVLGLWSTDRNSSQPRIPASAADFIEWSRRRKSFKSFAAQRFGAMNLSGINQPVRVRATFVTSEIFDVVGKDMRGPKVFIALAEIFAAVALALAAIGIYGVVAFSVSQRTHDIGVRMAVGAAPANVLRLVIADGLAPVVLGLGIGLASALALSQLLRGILYGVTPTDPITYIAVSVVLIAVASFACAIPGRRAVQVDPLIALHHD